MMMNAMLVGALVVGAQGLSPVPEGDAVAHAVSEAVSAERLEGDWDLTIPDAELPENAQVLLSVVVNNDGSLAATLTSNFDPSAYRGEPMFDAETGEMMCEFPGTPFSDLTVYAVVAGDGMAGQIAFSNGDPPVEFTGQRR